MSENRVEAAAMAISAQLTCDGEPWVNDFQRTLATEAVAAADAADREHGIVRIELNECGGSCKCEADPHFHGCFADRGNCTEPAEHEPRRRTITTAEELDALSDRSIVMTCHGDAVNLHRSAVPDKEEWHWITDAGPATVLHEPVES